MSLIITKNFKRANALDSAATDAKFKKGDRVWVPAKQKRGVIRGVSATGNQYEVEFMGGGGAYVNEEELEFLQALGNSRAADSCAMDAKFKVGDKVRRGKQIGIVRGIEKEPYIEVKFTDQPVTVFVHESEIVAADSRTAGDAADADDSFAFGIGEKVTFKRNGQNGRQWGVELTVVDRRHTDVQNEYTVKDVMGAKSKWWESWLEKYSSRAGDSDSEYELGMKVFKAVGKVEDEIVAGVRRAKQLVNNVPDEDVKRRLNRKLDDIAKIADSFDDTFI